MELIRMVIHNYDKKKGETESSITLATQLAMISELELEFSEKIQIGYSKNTGRIWGSLTTKKEKDSKHHVLPEALQKLENTDESFFSFSCEMMDHLDQIATPIKSTSGAFYCFLDLQEPGSDAKDPFRHIMIIGLSNKSGVRINERTMQIESVDHLHLDRINLAADIDLNRWIDNDPTNVSFSAGLRDVANYFREFIGSRERRGPEEESEAFSEAVKSYFVEKAEIEKTECNLIAIDAKIGSFLFGRYRGKRPVSITEAAYHLEATDDGRRSLENFMRRRKVSETFSPSKKHAEELLIFEYSRSTNSGEFKLELPYALGGNNMDSLWQAEYGDNGSVTISIDIHDCPDDIKILLDKKGILPLEDDHLRLED